MRRILGIAVAFAAGALGVTLVAYALEMNMEPENSPEANDAKLKARVLARLGQWLKHPVAIDVDVSGGIVRLTGPVLAEEVDRFLAEVAGMEGVRKVHNALRVTADPEAFTSTAAGKPRTATDELALAGWTPGI
jgi:osmotically-inducible protein OsmY